MFYTILLGGMSMKRMKKIYVLLILMLFMAMACPQAMVLTTNLQTVEAASVKLSKGKASLHIGKSINLKVVGTKRKVTWKSNNKTVASVKNGKVVGHQKGTAKITAIVGSKKYHCTVTVKQQKLNCIPSKKATFIGWNRQAINITGFSAKSTKYSTYVDYSKPLTSDYYYPYYCQVSFSGKTNPSSKGEKVTIYLVTGKDSVLYNIFGNLSMDATINSDGTFSSKKIIKLPGLLDSLYIRDAQIN